MTLVTTGPASRRFDLSTILEPGSTAVLGEVGSGKTYLATQVIGHALSDDKRVLLFDHYGEYSVAQAVADQFEQIDSDSTFCDRLTYMNPADHADVIVVDDYHGLSSLTQERLEAFMRVCRSYDLAVIVVGQPSMQLRGYSRQVFVGRCVRQQIPLHLRHATDGDPVFGSPRSIAVLDDESLTVCDSLD